MSENTTAVSSKEQFDKIVRESSAVLTLCKKRPHAWPSLTTWAPSSSQKLSSPPYPSAQPPMPPRRVEEAFRGLIWHAFVS